MAILSIGVATQAKAFNMPGLVSGTSVNVNGTQVNVNKYTNPNGSQTVNVGTQGQNVNVNRNATGTGTSVNVNGTQVDVNKYTNPDGSRTTNINTPGTNVTIQKSGDNLLIMKSSDGTNVNLDLRYGGLKVQVDSGKINANAESTLVNLSGDSKLLIQTNDDLNMYNNIVLQNRSGIKSISTDNGVVTVKYNQPARFLGMFSTTLGATVTTKNGEEVSIDLPWYSFLFSKDTNTVKTAISTGLSGNNQNTSVTLQNSNGDQKFIQVQRQAGTVNVVTSVIDAQNR